VRPRARRVGYFRGVNILETILIYVVIPAAVFGVAALLTLVPGRAKSRPKYHSGDSWDYPAHWWSGDNPVAIGSIPDASNDVTFGGARGTW